MNQRTESDFTPRMLGACELAKYLSMGKTRAVEFGKQCGACRRFGKRLLFDRVVIDNALNQLEE